MTPFAKKFASLLSERGEAARLSETTGVPSSHISKICAGTSLPSPETLAQLIAPLKEEDRAALVVEYLVLHRPKNAKNIRIVVDSGSQKDRLETAIRDLDASTRDSLASLVEAVHRSPETGKDAIRSLGSWFSIRPAPPADKNSPSEEKDGQLSANSNNIGESLICTQGLPTASPVTSTDIDPTAESPPATANIVQLPTTHWQHKPTSSASSSPIQDSKAAEDTQSPPVTEERQEDVTYTPPKKRRKSGGG